MGYELIGINPVLISCLKYSSILVRICISPTATCNDAYNYSHYVNLIALSLAFNLSDTYGLIRHLTILQPLNRLLS